MRRATQFAAVASTCLLAAPASALAAESAPMPATSTLHIGLSLVGLVVAVVLLFEALNVRKVALGGAIADKISYVILATICLAASALAQWARNFVAGLTLEQVQLASEILLIAAMALLAAYFASVRRALQGYLTAMTGGELLAEERDSAEPEAEEPAERG